MTDNQRFAQLLAEFRRVGVDPDTFSAVIAVTPAEALHVLAALPDGAGPAAFLGRLREARGEQRHSPPEGAPAVPPPAPFPSTAAVVEAAAASTRSDGSASSDARRRA